MSGHWKLSVIERCPYPGVKKNAISGTRFLSTEKTQFPARFRLKLFLRLWRTSQQYKPTAKKFKDGGNLLFRGLIIANTYVSRMRSWVSYRFQIDSLYTCGRAKTMRKHYEWTQICLKTEKKSCVFKRIRIRVDRALISKTTTLHVEHTFFVHFFAVTPRLRRQNA